MSAPTGYTAGTALNLAQRLREASEKRAEALARLLARLKREGGTK